MELWTVGHSNRSLDDFLNILRGHSIRLIVDVRRYPRSRRLPHFSRKALQQSLRAIDTDYLHLPELGGRRTPQKNSRNTAWRNAAFKGYADYMETQEFRAGTDRLLEVAAPERTAIMCAEACWWQCHRSLIGDYLKARGHQVWNIYDSRKSEEHPFTSAARIVEGQLSYVAADELPLD